MYCFLLTFIYLFIELPCALSNLIQSLIHVMLVFDFNSLDKFGWTG